MVRSGESPSNCFGISSTSDLRGRLQRCSSDYYLQTGARVAKTSIVAPFSGTMGLRQISPGAYVKTGDSIVRIEKISAIKLDFRVPELYAGRLARDQQVAISLDAFPGEKFVGRIYAIEPTVDEKSQIGRAHV